MNPGTNDFDDGSPPWLHPEMGLAAQNMVATVILVAALIGFVCIVIYGVHRWRQDSARRRRRQP